MDKMQPQAQSAEQYHTQMQAYRSAVKTILVAYDDAGIEIKPPSLQSRDFTGEFSSWIRTLPRILGMQFSFESKVIKNVQPISRLAAFAEIYESETGIKVANFIKKESPFQIRSGKRKRAENADSCARVNKKDKTYSLREIRSICRQVSDCIIKSLIKDKEVRAQFHSSQLKKFTMPHFDRIRFVEQFESWLHHISTSKVFTLLQKAGEDGEYIECPLKMDLTGITNMDWIKSLGIKSLELRNATLIKDLDFIKHLNLHEFHLYGSPARDFSILFTQKNLFNLHLQDCPNLAKVFAGRFKLDGYDKHYISAIDLEPCEVKDIIEAMHFYYKHHNFERIILSEAALDEKTIEEYIERKDEEDIATYKGTKEEYIREKKLQTKYLDLVSCSFNGDNEEFCYLKGFDELEYLDTQLAFGLNSNLCRKTTTKEQTQTLLSYINQWITLQYDTDLSIKDHKSALTSLKKELRDYYCNLHTQIKS